MKWIEVPASRILEVGTTELAEFDLLDENGASVSIYMATSFSLARRHKDNRLFKLSKIRPADSVSTDFFYLQEI